MFFGYKCTIPESEFCARPDISPHRMEIKICKYLTLGIKFNHLKLKPFYKSNLADSSRLLL